MDESEHIREFYARYGRSMYYAQVLEHGLVNTIVIARLASMKPPTTKSLPEWERLVDGLFDTHFEKTMGQLLSVLRSGAQVPAALEGLLKESLAARNFLAHDLFRVRVREGMTASGRDDLIDELEGYTELFRATDAMLEETIRPVRERLGMTDEALADEYRAMYPEADTIR